ncbi:RDD family protein [Actinomadura rudentiformis]|uniref:RDD family protein n=1 Tax=Actinomadura rudentiformis TaxID=359158 RepID=A0A6H9YGI1_9ACTN|nr:RDD family protein [Actinomadura rudentiformis]KAB2343988.1 RDD family protein [Actinomadura rudentiformis]
MSEPPPPHDPVPGEQPDDQPSRPPAGPPVAGPASLGRRLGAGLIDVLLLSVVTSVVSLPLVDWDRVLDPDSEETVTYSAGEGIANLIAVALVFLYFWFMTWKYGQTLGKKALGIRVVREEDGGTVDNSQALSRAGLYAVLVVICCCVGGIVDVAWILWDPRRQAMHDKVARTVVVRARPGTPDPYVSR